MRKTNLYYLQSRYYNPDMGRFINADAAEMLLQTRNDVLEGNLFGYCYNAPINYYDYSGYAPTRYTFPMKSILQLWDIVTYGNTYKGNRYLKENEQIYNAQIILNYFRYRGWTKNAICAMLGNMETESKLNPGLWQNRNKKRTGGFGLVQWTPASKYLTWAKANGWREDSLVGQMERIIFEMTTKDAQWSTKIAGMTFKEFSQSKKSPYDLAIKFLLAYERPRSKNDKKLQAARGNQAEKWFKILK